MFDYAAFVATNRPPAGEPDKKLSEWKHANAKGYLTFAYPSALEVEGKVLGLHLVATYRKMITSDLTIWTRSVLLARAYEAVLLWKKENDIPGEVAMAQQDMGWGTQSHFHIHFYIAQISELAAQGYKPRRLVDPMSRLQPV